jgi:hypothetical protein
MKSSPLFSLLLLSAAMSSTAFITGCSKKPSSETFRTPGATLHVDDKGFIDSLVATKSGKEYSPKGRASALMSLHESGKPSAELLTPTSAAYDDEAKSYTLKYANGSVATVKVEAKGDYFRFQLVSLTNRASVDNVVWGPVNTTISGKIGDITGVVRDEDFAIGMYGLDDNTITGAIEEGDCYGMGYFVHSADPKKHPLPANLKDGQWFNIGGDGVNDVAFYSHPEEYYNQVFGSGAKLHPEFGSSVAYYSRDRRRSYTHLYSLLPGFPKSRPRHMVSDPVPGVDYIGSAVALYACPDDNGVETLRTIFKNEGLTYVTDRDGKWIRDPLAARPTVYWNGPVDKAIEYTKALGLRDISRDTGEFYSSRPSNWTGHVNLGGKNITYKEFGEICNKEGLTHGGLHTLCMFLQGGRSIDVTPVPSENLQTICRTKLAKDISPTDTEIVVTDPSFLAEKGTWPAHDGSNYLRIGGEMLRYDGISETAPWTLKGIKRGHASKALAHKAGDELVKLQQNCYHGFVPDMKLLPAYADDYVDLMVRNGMDTINYDGYEVMAYTNHGYYAFNVFNRRLFEGYHAKTGKWPRVTGSNIFGTAWAHFNVCDVGGGNNMFNAESGRRNIEAKDIGNAYTNCWYPGTFGIQGWHSHWSLYDAQNLQAKAIGFGYTYALSVSADAINNTGEKDEILPAFNAWQEARDAGLFTKAQKEKLQDPALKHHLVKNADGSFLLRHVTQTAAKGSAGAQPASVALANAHDAQPLQFDLFLNEEVSGISVTLPDGALLECAQKIAKNNRIVCKGDRAYVADGNRKKIADLSLAKPATLPAGASKLTVTLKTESGKPAGFVLTTWTLDKGEVLKR